MQLIRCKLCGKRPLFRRQCFQSYVSPLIPSQQNIHAHVPKWKLIAKGLLSRSFDLAATHSEISRLRIPRDTLVYIITSWRNDTVMRFAAIEITHRSRSWWHIMVAIPIVQAQLHTPSIVCGRAFTCVLPHTISGVHFSNAISIHYSILNAA